MINFMSLLAEQIVLAIIVATIIEMILPQNKNKKYIQMIIGIYVLFNIISPIIKNEEEISIEKYNIESYTTSSQQVIDQTSMDERIEKIYLKELEATVTSKLEEKNIEISKCEIDAVLDTSKKNAGIHSINIKLRDFVEEGKITEIKKELATDFEIKEDIITIK